MLYSHSSYKFISYDDIPEKCTWHILSLCIEYFWNCGQTISMHLHKPLQKITNCKAFQWHVSTQASKDSNKSLWWLACKDDEIAGKYYLMLYKDSGLRRTKCWCIMCMTILLNFLLGFSMLKLQYLLNPGKCYNFQFTFAVAGYWGVGCTSLHSTRSFRI